jgi:hypothetical protein
MQSLTEVTESWICGCVDLRCGGFARAGENHANLAFLPAATVIQASPRSSNTTASHQPPISRPFSPLLLPSSGICVLCFQPALRFTCFPRPRRVPLLHQHDLAAYPPDTPATPRSTLHVAPKASHDAQLLDTAVSVCVCCSVELPPQSRGP